MSEWRDVSLGDVASISWGDTSTTKASYTDTGYVAFSASGPDGFLPYADHGEDGVVISAIGAQCGKTWYATGSWSCIKNTMWMRGKPGVSTKYLYYATSVPGLWPKRGAAQPFIGLGDAKAMRLRIPGHAHQLAIAAVLGAFDDLIGNNQKRVKVLEKMVRAIYREWFVQFRYPGHGEVPIIDSTFGRIPEGWVWGKVDDLVRVVKDTVDPSTLDSTTPAVGLEHIPRNQMTLDSWGNAGDQGSRKAVFEKGDVLFGKIRPYFHKVSVAPLDGISSIDAIVIRPLVQHWGQVALLASSAEFVAHATQTANGTKMPRADWKVLGEWPVPIPPAGLGEAFTGIARDQLGLAETLMFENRRLSELRNLLLPRLIKGQIDVSTLDLDALIAERVA